MKKKGQVTIFIIIGIVIVVSILAFFLWLKPTYFSGKSASLNFEGCVQDSVEQGIQQLEKKAGSINPEFTFMHLGEKITYLCYTNEFYKTCTVQNPLIKQHFEEELTLLIKENINTCYSNSVGNLRAEGHEVSFGEVSYELSLELGIVSVNIDAPTNVGASKFKKFNVELNSPIYEMIMLATSLIQAESKFGETDTNYLMALYPDYLIEKQEQGEGTRIYTIGSKIFGNKFKFAIRSLVFPPGFNPNL
jgi:hypothetical protein